MSMGGQGRLFLKAMLTDIYMEGLVELENCQFASITVNIDVDMNN